MNERTNEYITKPHHKTHIGYWYEKYDDIRHKAAPYAVYASSCRSLTWPAREQDPDEPRVGVPGDVGAVRVVDPGDAVGIVLGGAEFRHDVPHVLVLSAGRNLVIQLLKT